VVDQGLFSVKIGVLLGHEGPWKCRTRNRGLSNLAGYQHPPTGASR